MMDETRTETDDSDLIAEIRQLLSEVGADTGSLVMTSYESVDDGVHCHHFELMTLDGLRAGFFDKPEDVPEDEEDMLAAILELEVEPWDSLETEELIEMRDYLKSEMTDAPTDAD